MADTVNNTKALRLALLWTPQQLADRLGIQPARLRRLEEEKSAPQAEWAEAIAHAMGVPAYAVTSPDADIAAAAAAARPEQDDHSICRIAVRYAILAMAAKLGGLDAAHAIREDDLEIAIQNLALYTETEHSREKGAEDQLNRLSRSLQIAVLTILQSRGADPGPDLRQEMTLALDGSLSLLEAFSRIDRLRRDREKR